MTLLEHRINVNLMKQRNLLEMFQDTKDAYKAFELNIEEFNEICDDIFAQLERLAEQQEMLENLESENMPVFDTEDLPF